LNKHDIYDPREKIMNNWIIKQTEFNISQFDKAMEIHYPESANYLKDPRQFYVRIVEQCNYLDAIKIINWSKYLKNNSTVLDLGGGAGWLSAYLSKLDTVSKIYLLDSSKYFLHTMMPKIVQLMDGKADKIIAIEGLFSPLFFEDNSLDVVVICSSLHHSDNMEYLLREIYRVLKHDGLLFILNEIPHSYFRYLMSIIKQFIKITANTVLCRYKTISASISSSGFLYDPYLQDKSYPKWYWDKAIRLAGFDLVSFIKTGMFTLKNERRGIKLAHFICEKKPVHLVRNTMKNNTGGSVWRLS